jgi:hypothetical protein
LGLGSYSLIDLKHFASVSYGAFDSSGCHHHW